MPSIDLTLVLRDVLSEKEQHSFLVTYITLQMIGFVGCSFLLGTVYFSPTTLRHSTWFSFVFSWIISSFSYELLFIAGQLKSPPYGLCVTQAALTYAAPPLTAATTLALVTQVYFNGRNMFVKQVRRNEMLWSCMLLVTPYFIYAIIAIGSLIVGLRDPDTVTQSTIGTYCYLRDRAPSRTSSSITVVLMVATIALEVLICLMLRKNWGSLKRREYSISTALRLMVFTIFGIFAVAFGLVFASSNSRDPEINVILCLMPIAVFLIFGTQDDILAVWMFWRK